MRLGCKLNPTGQGTRQMTQIRRPSPPSLKRDAIPQGGKNADRRWPWGKKTKTHRLSMSVLLTLASLRSQETIISIMLIN